MRYCQKFYELGICLHPDECRGPIRVASGRVYRESYENGGSVDDSGRRERITRGTYRIVHRYRRRYRSPKR